MIQDTMVNLADDTMARLLKQYHKGLLEQGILSLATAAKDREYGALLVATTPEKVKLLKEKLRKFRHELLETLDTPPGEADLLISFGFQMFPIALSHEDEQQ